MDLLDQMVDPNALLEYGEELVNELSDRAEMDQLEIVRQEVTAGEERLARARSSMLLLQRSGEDINPAESAAAIMEIRSTLEGELARIKRDLGGNSYRLVADGDLSILEHVPGIEQILANNGEVKLLLAPDASGPAVLREIVQFLVVHEFRSEEPELEEIFIRAVRDADRER